MYSVKRYWDGRYELLCGRRRWLAVQGETERAPKARSTEDGCTDSLGYRRRLLSPHTSLHRSTEVVEKRRRPHRSPRTQATCAYIDFDPPIASRPPKSSTKSDRFSTRPGLPPRRVTGFVNERASSNRNHGASLANSYSARAHCSVISEIDTGLRNLRTCNQWESLMTSTESSELA